MHLGFVIVSRLPLHFLIMCAGQTRINIKRYFLEYCRNFVHAFLNYVSIILIFFLHYVTIEANLFSEVYMLYRKAYDKLKSWKAQPGKKALCIQGARQIGKTTVVREFGRAEYDCFVEFNFILDANARAAFDGKLDADTLIENLSALARQPMQPGRTLILLDEIQECPNARTAIKFLVEDGRFDYVETGSLLGVKNKKVPSYPVGFEEPYAMYPMDFEEFLMANGVQKATLSLLQDCYRTKQPVPEVIHDTINRLFYSYIIVGGMPSVVQTYVDTHDIGRVLAVQQELLDLYRQDISQYADPKDRPKIRAIFDSIPAQLNDKNRRFLVNSLRQTARLERYADSFNWLVDAGVALPCYNVTEPKAPLKLNEKRNLFKLFAADTGLLCALSMDNIQFSILQGDMSVNMGSILENMMAQMFTANGFSLHYFDTHKYGELDFVLQNGTGVDLVEIKSGRDYKRHAALDKIRQVSEWNARKSLVFCKGNVQSEDGILYLPWYMAMFYAQTALPEGLIYQVDLSDLPN